MSNKISKYEGLLDNSQFQKEMHTPTGTIGDINDQRNVLYSVHQRGKQKTLWYMRMSQQTQNWLLINLGCILIILFTDLWFLP